MSIPLLGLQAACSTWSFLFTLNNKIMAIHQLSQALFIYYGWACFSAGAQGSNNMCPPYYASCKEAYYQQGGPIGYDGLPEMPFWPDPGVIWGENTVAVHQQTARAVQINLDTRHQTNSGARQQALIQPILMAFPDVLWNGRCLKKKGFLLHKFLDALLDLEEVTTDGIELRLCHDQAGTDEDKSLIGTVHQEEQVQQ